jgi:hypothetical protein
MNFDQHPAVTTTARHLQRVDHTGQSYPPHGSVNAVDVRPMLTSPFRGQSRGARIMCISI